MRSLRPSASRRRFHAALAVSLAALFIAPPTHAGTPLICHPYAIGAAKSLPASDGDWKGLNPAYDRTHLVRDTLAILTADTPVIVRMETLRRAAIYATAGMRGWGRPGGFSDEDRANTSTLLRELRQRSERARGGDRALALFDHGFFAETLRHTNIDPSLDGYALIREALMLRGGSDAVMEFALALASSWPNRRAEHEAHLARARTGAQPGSLLATNLASHFARS